MIWRTGAARNSDRDRYPGIAAECPCDGCRQDAKRDWQRATANGRRRLVWSIRTWTRTGRVSSRCPNRPADERHGRGSHTWAWASWLDDSARCIWACRNAVPFDPGLSGHRLVPADPDFGGNRGQSSCVIACARMAPRRDRGEPWNGDCGSAVFLDDPSRHDRDGRSISPR